MILLAFFLAGCVSGGQPDLPSRQRAVSLEDAVVAPPIGGPQIVEVVERRYPNATEQRILLANRSSVPGENYLQVQFFGPVGNSGTGRTDLPNRPVSTANIAGELREAVALPMARSQIFVQNRYGPFGYAVGRAPSGDTCVYAWQRIAGVDTSTLLMRDRGTIQIRLRLCDRDAGEERLLYSMYGFTIRAFFSNIQWNPFGAPRGVDPRLGVMGEPIMPAGARGFEPVVSSAAPVVAEPAPRRRASAARAPAPVATAAPATPEPLPAPIGPLVPPPPAQVVEAAAPLAPSVSPSAAPPAVPAPVPPPPAAACSDEARAAGSC